jgi:glycosyltransferase involved in cell wall biosynthesis
MEAMSAGIPVVGGINSGGIPYVVGNGGLLVDVRSSKEIAEAIVTLLNSPKLRLELGNNGITRVQEVFSSEVVSSQLVDIYEHIIRSYGEAQIKY